MWLLSVVLMLAGATAMPVSARGEHPALDASAMLSTTVTVETVSHVRTDGAGDSVWTMGSGSGVLVSAERCEVWTNHHVVDNAAFVEVRVHIGETSRTLPARVVGSLPLPDVAVLELEQCDGIAEAQLGNSDRVAAGDAAFAVGNPFGTNPNTLTRGIVSHARRFLDDPWPYLQTDAAIGLGSSGGPLFNQAGEVIGLNVAIIAGPNRRSTGFGYAIPINDAAGVAEQIRTGTVARPDAGLDGLVNQLDATSAAMLGIPGDQGALVIARTPTDGPAAGRLYARDTIYRIDGRPVQSVRQFDRILTARQPGDRLSFELMRDGMQRTIAIELQNTPLKTTASSAEPYEGLLGIDLADWGHESGALGRYKHPVITRVYDQSPAHRAKISALQKSTRAAGPVLASFLLSVEMVTGAVLQGEYIAVADKETLDRIAARAHAMGVPMLLEVTSWRPENPRRPGRNMRFYDATLHRIVPAPSPALTAKPELDATDVERTSFTGGEA
ncbi:MAG: S1C family serine protease [Gammaproteobacteria bacterium]